MSPAPLQAGEVVRIRDERWRIVRRVTYDRATAIEAAGCDAGNRNGHATFLLPFETIERVRAYSVPRVVGRRRWRRAARRDAGDGIPFIDVRFERQRLRDLRIISFQLEPVLALVRGEGCRFLIADAVGLGKTVQAGLMIAETLARRPDGRTLVVAPPRLREQWREEIESRFGLGADILDAAGIARLTSQLPAGVNPWSVRPVVITSIDYIKRPEVMRSTRDAHLGHRRLRRGAQSGGTFRPLRSGQARSAIAPARSSCSQPRRTRVTTRHSTASAVSDVSDARAAPCVQAHETRCRSPSQPDETRCCVSVRRSAEVEMHRALMAYAKLVWKRSRDAAGAGAQLAMSVLARRACSSAASLVRSVERRLELLGQPARCRTFSRVSRSLTSVMTTTSLPCRFEAQDSPTHARSRAISYGCSTSPAPRRRTESKLVGPAAPDLQSERTGHRLHGIPRHASGNIGDARRHETVQLHGGLTARERNDVLRRFTDGTVRVLLATDAASEGLNLHERCRLVINLELPWTPLRLEQRAGRVDRIGQSRHGARGPSS